MLTLTSLPILQNLPKPWDTNKAKTILVFTVTCQGKNVRSGIYSPLCQTCIKKTPKWFVKSALQIQGGHLTPALDAESIGKLKSRFTLCLQCVINRTVLKMESKEVEETIKTILSNLSSKSISLTQVFTYNCKSEGKSDQWITKYGCKKCFWSLETEWWFLNAD